MWQKDWEREREKEREKECVCACKCVCRKEWERVSIAWDIVDSKENKYEKE
jgi:hypothetical protein